MPKPTSVHGYADPRRKWSYYFCKNIFRLAVAMFYNDIETGYLERFPKEGPAIVAINHSNSLVDAAITLATAPRNVRPTCKETLLKDRIFGMFIRRVESIGMRRRLDYKDVQVDNSGAFDAVMRELSKGCCVGLFPEGIGRYQPYLSPFKKGLARLCVDFVCKLHEERQSKDLHPHHLKTKYDYINIIPYGLTYLHRDMFRSSVCALIGHPIRIDQQKLKSYGLDLDTNTVTGVELDKLKFEISTRITQELRHAFDDIIITAPQWTDICLAHLARDIVFPNTCIPSQCHLTQYIDITRQLNQLLLKKSQDQDVENCVKELDCYWGMLYKKYGLTDQFVRTFLLPYVNSKSYMVMRVRMFCNLLRYLLQCSIWLILAIPTWIMAIPILLAWRFFEKRQIAKGIQKCYDDCAQFKLIALLFGSIILQFLYSGIAYPIFRTMRHYKFLSSLNWLSPLQMTMLFFVLWPYIMWCGVYSIDAMMANVRAIHSFWKVLWLKRDKCEELVFIAVVTKQLLLALVNKYNIKKTEALKKDIRTNKWWISQFLFNRTKKHWNEVLSAYDLPFDLFHAKGYTFTDTS